MKQFFKEYSNYIIAGLFFFLIVALSFKCNRPIEKPIITIDSTYIIKHHSDSLVIIDLTNKLNTKDSLRRIIEVERDKWLILYRNSLTVIKHLPLDSGVILLQKNLGEIKPFKVQVIGNDTNVLINPNNVIEVNSTYICNDYLQNDNLLLNDVIANLTGKDSLNSQIIRKYKEMATYNDKQIQLNFDQIKDLQGYISTLNKKVKRNKFVKNVLFGSSGALLLLFLLK